MALRPIFYDTETTGLRPEKERIVEIAAYDPVRDRTFERLINPGIPIPKEASAVHGITDEMVESHPSFQVVGRELIEFCDADAVLVAHNNDAFDMPFLKCEFDRNQLTMPSWAFFDSLKWARRYRPDLPRHTLQFLRDMYGIPANNAHRALDDVIVLHNIFTAMVDDIAIEEAMALLSRPREIKNMPFGKYQGTPLKNLPKDYVRWLNGSGALDKDDNALLKWSLQNCGVL